MFLSKASLVGANPDEDGSTSPDLLWAIQRSRSQRPRLAHRHLVWPDRKTSEAGGQLQDVSDEVLGAARIWRSTSSPLSGDTTSRPGPMLERAFRAELESSDFVRSCPVIVQVLAISAELVFGGFRPNLARFHDQFRPEFSQKSAISVELGPTLANFGFGVGDVRHEDLAGEFGPLWAMSAEFGPSRAKFQKRKLSSANSSLTRAQCMRACVWVCAGERVSARTRASERVRKGGSECVTESGYVATCGTYIDG